MSLSAKIRRAPQRAVTGAFILSTGLDKLREADDETAKGIHGMASGAYPVFGNMDPKVFLKTLGTGEVVLGSALLLPIVPTAVAGLGLAAFSGALLGVYWRTPGLRRGDSDVRPTQHGTPIAKDVWMFGIGTSLLVDSTLSRAHDKKVELQGAIKGAKKGAKVSQAAAGTTAGALTAVHAVTEPVREARTTAAAETRAAVKNAKRSAKNARRSAKLAQLTAAAQARATKKNAAKSAKSARKRAAAQTHDLVVAAREKAHAVKERVA